MAVAQRGNDQFPLRMPDGMRDRIKAAADANGRSMNSEIIAQLEGPQRTLRDWFAGQAVGQVLATASARVGAGIVARGAYLIADAMLAERSK